jgi:hypothetical protein
MKTFSLSLFCLLLGLSVGAWPARGQQPEPVSSKARKTGKVLVLENEHILEGDIDALGEQYRVRRAVGETWVPANRVLFLGDTMAEAYAFLRTRANLDDPDERLRLANWCRLNGLREQALIEVRAAVQLRPDHAPSHRLLQHLEQALATQQPPAAAPVPAHDDTTVQASLSVELGDEALGQFAVRVQPILMNACAGCHATGRGGSFHLTRAYDLGIGNRKTTQQNLAAVLSQVNLREPQTSSLLTKAVTIHGSMAQAPLRSRQAPAYRTLEDWVRITAFNNPQLQAPGTPATPTPPPAQGEPKWGQDTPRPAGLIPAVQARTAPITSFSQPPAPDAPPTPSPSATGAQKPAVNEPPDPFDPELFNRQMHPEQKPPAP